MKNTFKLIAAAALAASTATAAFAGNPEGVLNNQVEEPVVLEGGVPWAPVVGVAALAGLVLIAATSGGGGGGSSSTTGTTAGSD